ncbi:MAG: family 1 glycosylhydrolase, partial [Spirochaetota bacterium]
NDLEKINHSPDFIILRHSGFTTIRRGILSNYLRYREINPRSRLKSTGSVATIAPESLKTVLNSISERYGNPPVIVFPTCTLDIQSENGINDHVRTYFYRQYLAETHSAITRGINIIGFLAGPFIDGFEFDNKGQFRSGIVHVDFSTRERQIKSSAQWYSGVCTHNGFKP